jgi:signal transduction histidine kinase
MAETAPTPPPALSATRDAAHALAHAASAETARRIFWPGGLSARLLVLTVLFVLLAELLILGPSLATFEERWLADRVQRAELATLAVEAAPDQVITESMKRQLRTGAGVVGVAVQADGVRRLFFSPPAMKTPYVIDLRRQNLVEWSLAPFRTLFSGKDSFVRVKATTPRYQGEDFVEIVAPDAPLKAELVRYLSRLLGLTIFISAVAGVLVYLSLNLFLVKPMQRITRAMERFRADPDDPGAHLDPSGRRDEVGRAEVEFNRMQADLRAALNSRARLAALGEAVAKINHDLRNMLTSAQIASERVAMSGDPSVAQAMPRLERALDRAVRLATDVLDYGKTEEPTPSKVAVVLKTALAAAAEDAGIARSGVRLTSNIRPADRVLADPDQLHRILLNLLKNARQAVSLPERTTPGKLRVEHSVENGLSVIRVIDNGPGVPPRAQERLFQPFAGSMTPGGTGLGLAIARELAQAHGGDIALVQTGPDGSVFEVTLPGAAPVRRKT